MAKVDVTLELPDEVAEEAGEQGLLSPEKLAEIIRQAVEKSKQESSLPGVSGDDRQYPPGFDKRLAGAASPKLLGTVTYDGDITESILDILREEPDDRH